MGAMIMARRWHDDAPEDRGATLITVIVMMFGLLAMGGFAVDFGLAWAVKRQLSSTADASALAGAQAAGIRYAQLHPEGGGCKSADLPAYTSAATTAVAQTYTANAPRGSTGTPTPVVACTGSAIDVRVTANSTLPTLLTRLVGVANLNPAETAVARVAGSPGYGGLRPFAICIDDFPTDATGALNNTYQTNFPQNKNDTVTCGTASGQYGLVDFDGGSNPTGDLEEWTQFGYWGPISFPTSIFGDPGANVNPLSAELNYLVDNQIPILMPVYTGWLPGGGNNATFSAPGVISATLCGYSQDPKKAPDRTAACWDSAQYAAVKNEAYKLVLQWKYTAYVPSYQSSGTTGATECDLSQVLDPATGSVPCQATMRLWE
jgi:Flp pilus assembly protein TadG